MRVFDRSVSFEFKELGDGIFELRVTRWVAFFGLGFGRLKAKRYGDYSKCMSLVGVEIKGV